MEPYEPFAKPYINAHQDVGIKNVCVIVKKAQESTFYDINKFFKGEKADLLFSSHSFYFILEDMHKASLMKTSLEQHPLWHYFEMMKEDGVFVLTLQSGAGARLFRDAFVGQPRP